MVEPSEGPPRVFTEHKKESSTLTQEITKVNLENLATIAQDSKTILKLKMSHSVGGGHPANSSSPAAGRRAVQENGWHDII